MNAIDPPTETSQKPQEKPSNSPIPKVSARKYAGLGDVVAAVAQPVARTLDAVAGTNIAGCGGCAKRQALLNAVVPFTRP